jgi:hypothetical protein
VLSTEKGVSAAQLQKFLPQHTDNRLPMVVANGNGRDGHEFASEREILYTLFFDMKKDVTELKRLFFEVLKNPAVAHQDPHFVAGVKELQTTEATAPVLYAPAAPQPQPVLMHEPIHDHEEVDESLNIMDKEKELIIKALKKHRGKRKDASADLGISERTLYRKLKEYSIDE